MQQLETFAFVFEMAIVCTLIAQLIYNRKD